MLFRSTTGFDLSLAGLATLFALGLRHGLDPDHIAAIDGMALRAHDKGQPHARWTGGLFSLGHGLVVIAIAVLTAALSSQITPPKTLMLVAEWIPLIFLMWVGVVNLKALGWLVVTLAFFVMAWTLTERFGHELADADEMRTALGGIAALCTVVMGWCLVRSHRLQRTAHKESIPIND